MGLRQVQVLNPQGLCNRWFWSRVNIPCHPEQDNVEKLEEILCLCGSLSKNAKLRLFTTFSSYSKASRSLPSSLLCSCLFALCRRW